MTPLPNIMQRHERRLAFVLLCLVLMANAVALSAELRVGRLMSNDSNLHLSLLKGMVQGSRIAIEVTDLRVFPLAAAPTAPGSGSE